MSISFGSASKKPYVGSKEVKEAYVGGQLVYRSSPPIEYGFLGRENDYVLATWCQLLYNAAVGKEGGIYRIELTNNYDNMGTIYTNEVKGSKLLFTFKKNSQNSRVALRFHPSNKDLEVTQYFNENNYALCSVDVPAGTKRIRITSFGNYGITGWLDALRFEE